MVRTVFITRSDIGWYSLHANAQTRPRQLARDTRLTFGGGKPQKVDVMEIEK